MPSELLYFAVATDEMMSALAWGLPEGAALLKDAEMALHIALSDSFSMTDSSSSVSLALFSVEVDLLDAERFEKGAAGPWHDANRLIYLAAIPARAVRLMEVYIISAQVVEPDDVVVDLDVYGDFAAYL